MKKSELCTTLELSKLFGITRSDVIKCVAEGMPIIKRNQYNFVECFNWYADKKNLSIHPERVYKINMDFVGRKFLQIEHSKGIKISNQDSKGRLKTAPGAWANLLKEVKPLLDGLRSKNKSVG